MSSGLKVGVRLRNIEGDFQSKYELKAYVSKLLSSHSAHNIQSWKILRLTNYDCGAKGKLSFTFFAMRLVMYWTSLNEI